MKSFSFVRMWQLCRLDLSRIFSPLGFSGMLKAILLNSFSVCLISLIMYNETPAEYISSVENLLVLVYYCVPFFLLISEMYKSDNLIPKLVLPATVSEKYFSTYISSFIYGTILLIPSLIFVNIILYIGLPLFSGHYTQSLHLAFCGGGRDGMGILLLFLLYFYFEVLTYAVCFWKSYKKSYFLSAVLMFVLSYAVPAIILYNDSSDKNMIKNMYILISAVWIIVLVAVTIKGLKKTELQ